MTHTDNGGAINIYDNLGVEEDIIVKVFPNPCSKQFTLDVHLPTDAAQTSIELYDSKGNYQGHLFDNLVNTTPLKVHVNCSNFSSGLYYILTRTNKSYNLSPIVVINN